MKSGVKGQERAQNVPSATEYEVEFDDVPDVYMSEKC